MLSSLFFPDPWEARSECFEGSRCFAIAGDAIAIWEPRKSEAESVAAVVKLFQEVTTTLSGCLVGSDFSFLRSGISFGPKVKHESCRRVNK